MRCNVATSTNLKNIMTENNYLIYALQSPKKRHNLYVGQTNDYDRRMKEHQKEDSGCTAIARAIQKYGWENIEEFVLIEGLTKEQANYWEKHYISIFDCFVNGYNLTSGGDNYEFSQITKDKMSASQKALGDNHPMKTPEARERVSVQMKGNTYGKGVKMPPRTDEHRAKNSAAKTGQNNPMSATNRRRRFIAKCFDGGVFDLEVKQ